MHLEQSKTVWINANGYPAGSTRITSSVFSRLPGPRYSAHPDPIRELNKQNEIHLTVKCIALQERYCTSKYIFYAFASQRKLLY